MFFRRFSPMFSDMFDMPYSTRPRRHCQFTQQAMMPQEVFAFLGPWASAEHERSRNGGKMCRKNCGRLGGAKPMGPWSIERCPAVKRTPKVIMREEPWETTVKMAGFEPADLMVYLTGRTILLQGFRSEGDESSGIIKKEFRRKITIPKNVILPTVSVDFKDGNVVLSGRQRVFQKNEDTELEQSNKIEKQCQKIDGKDQENLMESPVDKAVNRPSEETSVENMRDDVNERVICREDKDNMDSEYPGNKDASSPSKDSVHHDVEIEDLGPDEMEDDSMSHVSGEIQSLHSVESVLMEENQSQDVAEKETKDQSNESKEKNSENPELSKVCEETTDSVNSDVGKEINATNSTNSEMPQMSQMCEYKPVTWSIQLHKFDPKDVKVHLVDNVVTVVAEHEEESDGMTFFRRMQRSFTLPEDVDQETLSSRFCADDGKLTIKVMQRQIKPIEQQEDSQKKQIVDEESGEVNEQKKDEDGWTVLPVHMQ